MENHSNSDGSLAMMEEGKIGLTTMSLLDNEALVSLISDYDENDVMSEEVNDVSVHHFSGDYVDNNIRHSVADITTSLSQSNLIYDNRYDDDNGDQEDELNMTFNQASHEDKIQNHDDNNDNDANNNINDDSNSADTTMYFDSHISQDMYVSQVGQDDLLYNMHMHNINVHDHGNGTQNDDEVDNDKEKNEDPANESVVASQFDQEPPPHDTIFESFQLQSGLVQQEPPQTESQNRESTEHESEEQQESLGQDIDVGMANETHDASDLSSGGQQNSSAVSHVDDIEGVDATITTTNNIDHIDNIDHMDSDDVTNTKDVDTDDTSPALNTDDGITDDTHVGGNTVYMSDDNSNADHTNNEVVHNDDLITEGITDYADVGNSQDDEVDANSEPMESIDDIVNTIIDVILLDTHVDDADIDDEALLNIFETVENSVDSNNLSVKDTVSTNAEIAVLSGDQSLLESNAVADALAVVDLDDTLAKTDDTVDNTTPVKGDSHVVASHRGLIPQQCIDSLLVVTFPSTNHEDDTNEDGARGVDECQAGALSQPLTTAPSTAQLLADDVANRSGQTCKVTDAHSVFSSEPIVGSVGDKGGDDDAEDDYVFNRSSFVHPHSPRSARLSTRCGIQDTTENSAQVVVACNDGAVLEVTEGLEIHALDQVGYNEMVSEDRDIVSNDSGVVMNDNASHCTPHSPQHYPPDSRSLSPASLSQSVSPSHIPTYPFSSQAYVPPLTTRSSLPASVILRRVQQTKGVSSGKSITTGIQRNYSQHVRASIPAVQGSVFANGGYSNGDSPNSGHTLGLVSSRSLSPSRGAIPSSHFSSFRIMGSHIYPPPEVRLSLPTIASARPITTTTTHSNVSGRKSVVTASGDKPLILIQGLVPPNRHQNLHIERSIRMAQEFLTEKPKLPPLSSGHRQPFYEMKRRHKEKDNWSSLNLDLDVLSGAKKQPVNKLTQVKQSMGNGRQYNSDIDAFSFNSRSLSRNEH